MLPFPTNSLIGPQLTYGTYEPPFVPNIAVSPEVQDSLIAIASTVANEISLSATSNPLRTFAFNLVNYNYFDNAVFSDLIRLSADILTLNIRKKKWTSHLTYINEAVKVAVSLYCGNLIKVYPEIQEVLEPRHRQGALDCINKLNSIQLEIREMNNGRWNSDFRPNPNNWPQDQPLQQDPRAFMQYHQPMPGYDPRYPGNQYQTPPPRQPNNQYYPPMTGYDPRFNQQIPQQASPFYAQDHGIVNTGENTLFKNTDTFSPQVPSPSIAPVVKPDTTIKVVTCFGGNEMDRAQHSLQRFSTTPVESLSYADNLLREAVKELKEPPITEVKAETRGQAIILAKRQRISKASNDSVNSASSYVAVISNPIIPEVEMANLTFTGLEEDETNDKPSFKGLVEEINHFISQTNNMPKDSARLLLNTLTSVDKLLTEKINYFLSTVLSTKVKIESFMEDGLDLPHYLEQKYGSKYAELYVAFEKDFMQTFSSSDKTEPNELQIPVLESITFVPLTNSELGYNITEDWCLVDYTTTGILYKTIENACNVKDHHSSEIYVHTLLTVDNVNYLFYKDKITNKFYIKLNQ